MDAPPTVVCEQQIHTSICACASPWTCACLCRVFLLAHKCLDISVVGCWLGQTSEEVLIASFELANIGT